MRRVQRYSVLSALVAGIVLVGAQNASAGIIDIIFEMSGPQMIGKGARCRVSAMGGVTRCDLFGIPRGTSDPDIMTDKRWWVNLEGAFYTSTGKNEGNTDYEAFRTFMLSFEPLVEVASKNYGTVRVFHGIGLASHFLFGPDFDSFTNAGYKLRPIAVEIGNRWELALNVRLYPNGFGADQFGFGPSPPGDRPFEHTWGFTVGIKY